MPCPSPKPPTRTMGIEWAPLFSPCAGPPAPWTQSPLPSPTRNSPKTSMNVSQHRLQQTSVLSSTSVVSARPPSRIVSATPGTGRRPICLYASSHCVMMDGKRQVIYALPTGVSAVRQTGSAPETALRTATTFLPLDYDCAVLVSALRTVNTKFMPVLGHVRSRSVPGGAWICTQSGLCRGPLPVAPCGIQGCRCSSSSTVASGKALAISDVKQVQR